MKISLIKIDGNHFVPAYNSDYDKDKKIKRGEVFEYSVRKERNHQFHKKYFALMNLVFQNQEAFDNLTDLRYWITMKAGFYRKLQTPSGQMFMPESISFDNMDDFKFSEVYEKIIQVIEKYFSITSEIIEANIGDFY